MTLKKPIIAAICAVVLFGFFLWDVDNVERAIMQSLQDERVIWQNPETATLIEFRSDGGVIRVERSGLDSDDWMITEPGNESANGSIINTWLENLRGAKRHSQFVADDLAEYGLDDPAASVTISLREDDGSALTHTLLFGSQPYEFGRVYAMLEGTEDVFTISEWFYKQSLKNYEILRDRTIVRIPVERAQTIDIHTRVQQFTAVRNESGSGWTIDHDGESLPADTTLIDRVMFNLNAAKFVEIIDNPTSSTAQLGLDSPVATIHVDEKPVMSIGTPVGSRDRFVVENSENMIGTVPASLLTDYFRPPLEWGTKRFIWLAPEEITQLEIYSAGSSVMMINTMGEWIFADRPGVPTRADRIADYFQTITAMQAMQLVEPKLAREDRLRYGIVDDSYHVSVSGKDGSPQGFIFGRTDTGEGQTYVLRTQDQSLWKMDFRGKVNAMQFRKDFEENRILPGLAAQVDSFYFETQGQRVAFEKVTSGWAATLPNAQRSIVRPDLVQTFLYNFEAMEIETETITETSEPNVMSFAIRQIMALLR